MSEPAFADGVEVVGSGVAALARTSEGSPPAADDDRADEVTIVPLEAEIASVVCTVAAVVSAVGDSVTRSPLAVVVVDCALWGDDALMSAPVVPPALRSAGLLLLIGATLVAGAGPAAAGADEAGEAAGVEAVVEAELDVAAGGALAVEDGSEVVGCGAGLLTVVVVSAGGPEVVVAGVDAAAVVVEAESVAVDVWSAGAEAVALESCTGAWSAVLAGVDVDAGAAGVAVVAGAAGVAVEVEAGAGAGAGVGLAGGGLEGGAAGAAAGADDESLTGAAGADVAAVAAAGAAVGAAGAAAGARSGCALPLETSAGDASLGVALAVAVCPVFAPCVPAAGLLGAGALAGAGVAAVVVAGAATGTGSGTGGMATTGAGAGIGGGGGSVFTTTGAAANAVASPRTTGELGRLICGLLERDPGTSE
jgi:hypothetical protein